MENENEEEHEHTWELELGPLAHRYRCPCGVLGYARGNGMGQRLKSMSRVKPMRCTLKVKKGIRSTTCGADAISENGLGHRFCKEHKK